MFKNYKIVCVTPSGRSRYQKILFEYLRRNKETSNIIDEYRIWQNTTNQEDVSFFQNLKDEYDWVTIDQRKNINGIKTIGQYFDRCCEPNTIYIRLDDDIVYLAPDFIENLIDFRIKNPKFFLVFGNIINNDICNHIHARIDAFNEVKHIKYGCANNAWKHPNLAKWLHTQFLDSIHNNSTDKYKFDKYVLTEIPRFSINAICWFGEDMKKVYNKLGGVVHSEEHNLTQVIPGQLNKYNAICGSAICSHFAFYTQRKHLDNTDILNQYESLL